MAFRQRRATPSLLSRRAVSGVTTGEVQSPAAADPANDQNDTTRTVAPAGKLASWLLLVCKMA